VLYLDHLTVAALSLDEGVAHVRRALGVEIPPGGAHPIMGTHNHLMQLGNSVFLEVIAPDRALHRSGPDGSVSMIRTCIGVWPARRAS